VYIALIVVDHVSGVFLSALKFNKNTAVVSSIQSLLLLMLTYILIKEFGVFGAALASLIAFVSTSLWYNPWHLWRSIQSKY
jgi:Na+-driven multidrug efflux pump